MKLEDHQTTWIIKQNIARFEQMLEKETDSCRREILKDLIERESDKLNPSRNLTIKK